VLLNWTCKEVTTKTANKTHFCLQHESYITKRVTVIRQ